MHLQDARGCAVGVRVNMHARAVVITLAASHTCGMSVVFVFSVVNGRGPGVEPEKSRQRSLTGSSTDGTDSPPQWLTQSPYQPLQCPGGVNEALSDLLDETNLQKVQCLLPNGIVVDVFVHPDDELFHIKQVVIDKATKDGKERVQLS